METNPHLTRPRFQPSIPIRLACWIFIYFGGAYFWHSGLSIKPMPGYNPFWDFWVWVPMHFPVQLQMLILVSIGHFKAGSLAQAFLVLSYLVYLFNLVLCLALKGKKLFGVLLICLVILVILNECGGE